MMRNSAVVLCLWFLILFWPLALVMPRELLFDGINALGVTLGIAVLLSYAGGVVDAIKNSNRLQQGHYLVLGIFATWVAMIGRTAWLWGWRWMGEPQYGLDHILVAFVAWLIIVGGILHLLSPRVIDGNVPEDGWIHLMGALATGGVLWAVVVALRLWSVE